VEKDWNRYSHKKVNVNGWIVEVFISVEYLAIVFLTPSFVSISTGAMLV
jgi:hypothetical protein